MCLRLLVLAFLILNLTTTDILAIYIDCYQLDCILYQVRSNNYDEIDFPRKFNWNAGRTAESIEIKKSKFDVFPRNLFEDMPNVKSVQARDCGLVTLTKSFFGPQSSYNYSGFELLDLANNLLTTLEAGIFHPTRDLITLDLSLNRLSEIDALAFNELFKLKNLYLSANQLTTLDQAVFMPLVSLETLDLHCNQLQAFNFDMFVENNYLDILNLAENKLSTLQATLVNDAISHIDLRENQLGNISALGKMDRMHTLLLSDNKEVDLIAADFCEMAKLNRLQLDGVNLQHRLGNNYQFLEPLCQLTSLYIGRNNLTSLSQFPFLPKISELVVDENKINNLDVTALKVQFPELTEINISNNAWECSTLRHVLHNLKQMQIKLIFRGGGYPVLPEDSLTEEWIVCSNKQPFRGAVPFLD